MVETGFTLWFCLLFLYLIESLRFTTGSAVVFRPKLFGKHHKASASYTYPGNGRWGWTLLPLFPFYKATIICQQPLVAWTAELFSPNVFLTFSRSPAVAYNSAPQFEREEKTLRLDGKKFVRCDSQTEAQRLQDSLAELTSLSPDRRILAIERETELMFDQAPIAERIKQFNQAAIVTKRLSGLLWYLLIVLLPLLLLRFNDSKVLLAIACLTLVLDASIAVAFSKAAGKLYPRSRRKYRWISLKFIFYPVASLRALDDLAAELISGAHPITLAKSLCSSGDQLRLARRILRVLRRREIPVPNVDPAAVSTASSYAQLLVSTIESFLRSHLPVALEAETPLPKDATCRAYCPICGAQYARIEGFCADCPGTALESF